MTSVCFILNNIFFVINQERQWNSVQPIEEAGIVATEVEVGYGFKLLQVVSTDYETYDASFETDED